MDLTVAEQLVAFSSQEACQVALALLRAARPVLPDREVPEGLRGLPAADLTLALLHNAAGLAAQLEEFERRG